MMHGPLNIRITDNVCVGGEVDVLCCIINRMFVRLCNRHVPVGLMHLNDCINLLKPTGYVMHPQV